MQDPERRFGGPNRVQEVLTFISPNDERAIAVLRYDPGNGSFQLVIWNPRKNIFGFNSPQGGVVPLSLDITPEQLGGLLSGYLAETDSLEEITNLIQGGVDEQPV